MNFRGHLTGGLIAGGIATGVSLGAGYVSLNTESIQQFVAQPFHWEGEIQTLIGIYVTTLFMALFPDLDIGSIPQRWFFRGIFLLLVILYFQRQMELFSFFAFVAILPVMHKHRGWTHWKITPWLISLFLAVIIEYFETKGDWAGNFSWENVLSFLQEFWGYVFACVLGHYTHLLLDSRKIHWLPFISNSKNHH